jgi:hypothetical protein
MLRYDQWMVINIEKNKTFCKLNDWFGKEIFIQKIFSISFTIISILNIIWKWTRRK